MTAQAPSATISQSTVDAPVPRHSGSICRMSAHVRRSAQIVRTTTVMSASVRVIGKPQALSSARKTQASRRCRRLHNRTRRLQ